jgi:hypothetical protein
LRWHALTRLREAVADVKLEWDLRDHPAFIAGNALWSHVTEIIREQLPDLVEMFPFRRAVEIKGFVTEEWLAVRVADRPTAQIPEIGDLTQAERDTLRRAIEPFAVRSHQSLHELLGANWFSFDTFTYVGPFKRPHASWPDASQHLIDWLNHLVVPTVLDLNRVRVLRAIPQPPQFNADAVRSACWVLECEASSRQGTAFALKDVGLVTCEHVLGPNTVAFRPDSPSTKFNVEVLSKNSTIDLAVLRIPASIEHALKRGTADRTRDMDHLAVCGFPNYRIGDTGVLAPGLVTGFRTVSSIRRILTNAHIVAGMSGGPVLGSDNVVIGVAVTGADSMERVQETENHGVVPIDAISYLIS